MCILFFTGYNLTFNVDWYHFIKELVNNACGVALEDPKMCASYRAIDLTH